MRFLFESLVLEQEYDPTVLAQMLAGLPRVLNPDIPIAVGMEQQLAALPEEWKAIMARVTHEEDHLRRSLTTTNGHLLYCLFAQRLTTTQLLVIESFQRDGGIRFPLVKPFSVAMAPSLEELLASADPVYRAKVLVLAGYALVRALLDEEFDPQQFGWIRLAVRALHWDLGDDSTGNSLPDFETGASPPLIVPNSGGIALSGGALYEFFGIVHEHHLESGLAAATLRSIELLRKERTYSAVMRHWLALFPDGVFEGGTAGGYRTWPLELIAAADLALWIPFLPSGFARCVFERGWREVHSGHRFQTLLHHLRVSSPSLSRIGTDDQNEQFRTLQDDWARALGWPTVDSLINAWLHWLNNATPEDILLVCADPKDSVRFTLMRELLTARGQRPLDFCLGALLDEPNVEPFAAILGRTPTGTRVFESCWAGVDKGYGAGNYFLHLMLRRLTFDDPHARDELYSFEDEQLQSAFRNICAYLAGSPNWPNHEFQRMAWERIRK